jgi:hypothetical protein
VGQHHISPRFRAPGEWPATPVMMSWTVAVPSIDTYDAGAGAGAVAAGRVGALVATCHWSCPSTAAVCAWGDPGLRGIQYQLAGSGVDVGLRQDRHVAYLQHLLVDPPLAVARVTVDPAVVVQFSSLKSRVSPVLTPARCSSVATSWTDGSPVARRGLGPGALCQTLLAATGFTNKSMLR